MAEEQSIDNVVNSENIEQPSVKEEVKAEEVKEEVSNTEEAGKTPETNSAEDKKEEIPSWAFGKMSKKIKSEVKNAVTEAMQVMLQMQYNQHPSQQQYTPNINQGVSDSSVSQNAVDPSNINSHIDNYFIQKRQQELALKEAEKVKSFNVQVEAAREKFDDYDDFVQDAGSHLTQPMFALMTEVPNSVENFKLAWDEDKSRIMSISKLSPAMQIAELKRVLDDVDTRRSAQKYKPTASKPISPVSSTSNNVTKESNSFTDIVRNRYRRLK